jgi:hypothetical protein
VHFVFFRFHDDCCCYVFVLRIGSLRRPKEGSIWGRSRGVFFNLNANVFVSMCVVLRIVSYYYRRDLIERRRRHIWHSRAVRLDGADLCCLEWSRGLCAAAGACWRRQGGQRQGAQHDMVFLLFLFLFLKTVDVFGCSSDYSSSSVSIVIDFSIYSKTFNTIGAFTHIQFVSFCIGTERLECTGLCASNWQSRHRRLVGLKTCSAFFIDHFNAVDIIRNEQVGAVGRFRLCCLCCCFCGRHFRQQFDVSYRVAFCDRNPAGT